MPAKRSHRPAPNRRRTAPVRASSVVTPLEKFTSLHDEVEAWLAETAPDLGAEELQSIYRDMAITVRMAQEAAGLTHLGAWTIEHVQALVAAASHVEGRLIEDAGDAGAGGVDPAVADLTERVVAALGPLTVFLVSTDRWTGSQEDLDDVHSLLDHLSPAAVQARALAEVLDRPDDPAAQAAEAAALTELPLAKHLVSLLRWVEPGREETGDLEPRPQDLPEAAAAIGVTVDPAQPPQTLADVPRLWAAWVALDAADLLRHEDGRVTTALGSDALASDAPIPAEQLRDAVGAVISELLQDAADDEIDDTAFDEDQLDDDEDLAPPSATAVAGLPLLGAAACGEEVSAEVLAAADELADTGALIAELSDLGVLREGTSPGSVVVTPGLEKVLAGPVLDLLEEIAFDEVNDEEWDDDEV